MTNQPKIKPDTQIKVNPPHCPECKKELPTTNMDMSPIQHQGALFFRFTTWCNECGCVLGCLTMPAAPPSISDEANPFAPPNRIILDS